MTENSKVMRLRKALAELVYQVERSGARDSIGHPLKNLEALQEARQVLSETGGLEGLRLDG
jgi:hypothetical protein